MAVLLTILAAPAAARVERCVRNVAEFNIAWTLANSDEVLIKLAAGTYDFAQTMLERVNDDVEIRGGYDSNCASRSEAPGATVITHGSGGIPLFLTGGTMEEGAGTLRFDRVTFRGSALIQVAVEESLTNDSSLTLERVWLDQIGRFNLTSGAEFRMRNSAVTRSGSCAMTSAPVTPPWWYLESARIEHSTFAANQGPGLCVGLSGEPGDDWRLDLINSVFWDDGGIDIRLSNVGVATINAELRNNTYTAL